MFPVQAGSKAANDRIDPGTGSSGSVDLVRVGVQAMLAIYLSPVIALVCLIGGAAVVAGKVAKGASRLFRGRDDRPSATAAPTRRVARPRMIYRRERSRSIR